MAHKLFLKKSCIFEHTSVQILIYTNMVMSILGAKAESPMYIKKNPAKRLNILRSLYYFSDYINSIEK